MNLDHRQMKRLTDGIANKSEKMRVLGRAGYERADIARFLGTSYQFVRNVLLKEQERSAQRQASAAGSGGHGDKFAPAKLRLGPDGRVLIPAAFRDALGLSEGDTLIALIDDGELNLLTRRAAVKRAQAIVRQFVPEGVSLVDELIEDRRREAEREKND
jgi:AbrB family looped-hinge helix DNA binding protein